MRYQLILAVLASTVWSTLQAQDACGPHYRWNQKIDESQASQTATKVSITTMLNSWAVLPFTSAKQYHCIAREAQELRVYSVTGWVRRVRRNEADGDWHIELTAAQTSPVASCIVVEIPSGSGNFSQARTNFDALVGSTSTGDEDFNQPVRLRFIGPAFFDGEHRGAGSNPPHGHGRCNSSTRALWELHPVYFVKHP